MKLSAIEQDVDRIEAGDWVENIPDMADLRLKVRGINNADYRRLQARMIEGVPRANRIGGRLSQADQDRITSSCLASTVLLDWQGLENDDGTPLAYDKATATRFLTEPKFKPFRDAVVWAATVVGEQRAASEAEDAGNSPRSSAGS